MKRKDIYGLVHPASDIHTLGISYVHQLLEDCGMEVFIGDENVITALNTLSKPASFQILKKWILKNGINNIGFSYRLDPDQALEMFDRLIFKIYEDAEIHESKGGPVKNIFFAGLPSACDLIRKKFGKRFETFIGDETPYETLIKFGIPDSLIPKSIQENSVYDDLRYEFGKQLINKGKYLSIKPNLRLSYKEYGTIKDHLALRIKAAGDKNLLPLFRVHSGPFLKEREKAVLLFMEWMKRLSEDGFLDIMSIGSSQLTQSNFGEDWKDMPNGGGVPVNSEIEFRLLWEVARPMLVRAYSGTKNIQTVAKMLEKNINIAWHALSLWWFNKMDGRGPLPVKECLIEHCNTLKYIASTNKPFEPNVPHHFAFRGSDDLSYIVSTYLAVRTAKQHGIKFLVLQNMLNTPKSTSGITDIAKSRAILQLVKPLVGKNFRIFYQPRAGLDYFSPDLEKAKIQLASISALMTDVRPQKLPEIIHVVSYSEASHLADPVVINESIKITKAAIQEYPKYRNKTGINEILNSKDVIERTDNFLNAGMKIITHIEKNIKNPYSPTGLYEIFKAGYLPVPYIYNCRDEFPNAVKWKTKVLDGEVKVVNDNGLPIMIDERLRIIKENIGLKK